MTWRDGLLLVAGATLLFLGAYTLVQDQRWAASQARNRAEKLIDQALPELSPWLDSILGKALLYDYWTPYGSPEKDPLIQWPGNSEGSLICLINSSDGSLAYPFPYRESFDPLPYPTAQLNPTQKSQWDNARLRGSEEIPTSDWLERYTHLIQSNLPKRLQAVAEYERWRLLTQAETFLYKNGDDSALLDFLIHHGTELSDTGIPFGQLAWFTYATDQISASQIEINATPSKSNSIPKSILNSKLPLSEKTAHSFFHSLQSRDPDELKSAAAVLYPSLLSQSVLEQLPPSDSNTIGKVNWIQVWNIHSRVRSLYQGLPKFSSPKPPLPDQDGFRLISAPTDHSDYHVLAWISESGWRKHLNRFIDTQETNEDASKFFSLELECGQLSTGDNSVGAILASRTGIIDSSPDFVSNYQQRFDYRLSVRLTDSAGYYDRIRKRQWVFGFLILTATLTALVGWQANRRSILQLWNLNRMKSDFVSSVTHELRAPIASIGLLSEGLLLGRIRSETKRNQYFGLIHRECRRLSSLIENVLGFSQMDRSIRHYHFEPTDAGELVKHIIQVMQPTADDKNIRLVDVPTALSENPTAEHQTILMDGKAVEQALINLLDNAIKFSPPDKSIEIEWQIIDRETGSKASAVRMTGIAEPAVKISIIDQGPGVPPEDREKVFEKFYRRGNELRRETTGIGIGLSIVQHVAQAHGGSICIENDPDQRTRFTLVIPSVDQKKGKDRLS